MPEYTIRVGIVGAGENTVKRHIPGLRALDGVEIRGVCNRSRESSERVAREQGIPDVYEDWVDMVYDEGIDAIVIGTWPYMHCPVTLAALENEKHVLTEARMSRDAAEARAMLEAARTHPHLVAQVVPSPFTLEVDSAARRMIGDGFLGEILAIEVRAGGSFLNRNSPLHWRQDFDLSGFNIMTLGIWYEALMRWVGEAVRVTAMGRTFARMRKDSSGVMRSVRIPEHVDVIAEMACGAQAHFQISSVTGLIGLQEMVICGSEGTLRFSEGTLQAGRRGDPALAKVEIPAEERTGWRVEEEFIRAIRGEEKVKFTTFEDGVKYMEFTEGAARSMASGLAVSLPLE